MDAVKQEVYDLVVFTYEEITGIALDDPDTTYCKYQQECDALNTEVRDKMGINVHFDTDMTVGEFIDEVASTLSSLVIS